MSLSLFEKSRMLLEETIDTLRNKPIKSTYMERYIAADKACELYSDLPQPLYLGYGLTYMLETVSCPVKKHDILLGRVAEWLPSAEEENWLTEIEKKFDDRAYFMVDGGHITLDWGTILRRGISGYIAKSESVIENLLASGAEKERILYLEGMNLILRAYRRYMLRYADAAEETGLHAAAIASRNIADNPPATFYEALQLVLYITHVYCVYAAHMNATLVCGRLDDLLFPYYEKDIADGILTREEAGCIIDDFNCKLSLVLGRGEHQLGSGEPSETGWFRNPMYDSPTYIILGGKSNYRHPKDNPLTQLFIEHIHPRLENPVYVFRHTAEDDAALWNCVCDKLRLNSSLMVYNDETVIGAMEKAGIEHEDAVNYSIVGCNWPALHGCNVTTGFIGGPLPVFIMDALFDKSGAPRRDFQSMDDVYNAIAETWLAHIRPRFAEYRKHYEYSEPALPKTLCCADAFLQGVLEEAREAGYAVKYRVFMSMLRNIGTAADILSALDHVAFAQENPVSMDEIASALKANFEGHEVLHKRLKNAPKYGHDDDRADEHAVRLLTLLQNLIDQESIDPNTGKRNVFPLNTTIADMGHITTGRDLGATPDGRPAGVPVSENLSPSEGSTESVTALLNSVAKLPFDRISSGAFNVRMPKNLVSGDAGLARLKVLLDTYFANGGMQFQLSVADTSELKDAQLHPEKYPDLMVRITGYSAVFIDMCKKAQDEIIRREEAR
ncbi:MAG: hypothetical protein E7335_08340 [Clostridiales bacterium]|nr:hypothetical protein [Clostridiales bacterium]